MPCRYAWCWLVPKCHASEKGPTLFSLHCKTGNAMHYLQRLTHRCTRGHTHAYYPRTLRTHYRLSIYRSIYTSICLTCLYFFPYLSSHPIPSHPRYPISYLSYLHLMYFIYLIYISYLSDLFDLSDLSYFSGLSDISNLLYLSDLSDLFYVSSLPL